MQTSLTFICRGPYLLIAILCVGCFPPTPTSIPNTDIENQAPLNNLINTESSIDNLLEDRLKDLQDKIDTLELYSAKNTSQIKTMRDSLKAFYQLNISGDTSDKDIINSLIRIQSKLNIIEEKIFYSDSIYFNLLNDLVLIESQIENLDKNLISIIDLNDTIDNNQNDFSLENSNQELSFDDNYEIAREYYLKKNYMESLKIFKYLVELDSKHPLADNSQFWIGEIYYIDQSYEIAIVEYQKVSTLGDDNKTPYADYKIALCYVNLDEIDKAIKQFKNIISYYPGETDLTNKSQKYIERYK